MIGIPYKKPIANKIIEMQKGDSQREIPLENTIREQPK